MTALTLRHYRTAPFDQALAQEVMESSKDYYWVLQSYDQGDVLLLVALNRLGFTR